MTFEECKEKFEKWTTYFSKVLFDDKSITSYEDPDIKNIAYLQDQSSRKLGELYDENITYEDGDIVSYNFEIYQAKEQVSGVLPTDDTKWIKLEFNRLEKGEYLAKGFAFFNIKTETLYENYNIGSIYKVSENESENYKEFQFIFSPNINISNTNYSIFFEEDYCMVSCISKSDTGFLVRVKEEYFNSNRPRLGFVIVGV